MDPSEDNCSADGNRDGKAAVFLRSVKGGYAEGRRASESIACKHIVEGSEEYGV